VPEALVDGLRAHDAVVLDGALAPERVAALRSEAEQAHAAGRFAAGRIGVARDRSADLRGDATCWLDALPEAVASARLLAELDAWRGAIDRGLLLGLRALEAQFARYPAGAGYARHLDRFVGGERAGARLLSLVIYLNDGWREADGGALRLYDASGRPHEVAPIGGRLVAFLSDRVEHEVLPAARPRWSVAAWLKRDAGPA
jgi:SM-20-related protein